MKPDFGKIGAMQNQLALQTSGPGLYEFTDQAQAFVRTSRVKTGLLTAFVRHTSASLLVQENADPSVQRDLLGFFERLAPPADDPSMAWLTHTFEGPDDMPAHIKAALLPTHLCIPVSNSQLILGTWQGIYLVEHRARPHERQVALHLSG